MKLPIGVSDFSKLIKEECQFVDKTLFIKEIIDDGAEVILITRPRRFGKTLNLSMLKYFFEIKEQHEQNLFANLLISQDAAFCNKHQHKYPVIFLSFKDIKKDNFLQAYAQICTLISNLYKEHRYLLKGDCLEEDEKDLFNNIIKKNAPQNEIENSLITLAKYLMKKFNQPAILLLDEYDTPIEEAYLKGYYAKMMGFMRGALGQTLKDNSYLKKAVVTGITRISQESLFSGVNNLSVYSLLREKYGQYFGFIEDEVKVLIKSCEVSLEKIKEWYNGYKIGKYTLYNPWSILNCLDNNGKLAPYWLNTATNGLLYSLISKANIEVKDQLELLLQGQVIQQTLSENLVFKDIERKPEALWSLLLYTGYLQVLTSQMHGNRIIATMAIPNKEVSFVYDQIVEAWFSEAINLSSYDFFIKSLATGDLEKFKLYLASYIMQTGSYFDFNSNTQEQIFHIFVLGLVAGLRDKYIISSNKESGIGRYDVLFIPKDKQSVAMIMEFKTSSNIKGLKSKAQEAVKQIKEKKYPQELVPHTLTKALAIGLAFCGKHVELVHEEIALLT
jgi:Predicted AAA-ATPase/PD-(D/E)XK nuclease superfamily